MEILEGKNAHTPREKAMKEWLANTSFIGYKELRKFVRKPMDITIMSVIKSQYRDKQKITYDTVLSKKNFGLEGELAEAKEIFDKLNLGSTLRLRQGRHGDHVREVTIFFFHFHSDIIYI
jgi:hypothetical protein